MPSETLQLYVLEAGNLELTDDGRWISECRDHKYLESLLHQICDKINVAFKDKLSRMTLVEKYEEAYQQLRADFEVHRISFDSYRSQVNGLGPNPESPLYRTEHNLGDDYPYLIQIDYLIRELNASRDLVSRRIREISAQSKPRGLQTRAVSNVTQPKVVLPVVSKQPTPSQAKGTTPQPSLQPKVATPVTSKAVRQPLTETEQRIESLRRAASRGDATARFTLGQHYENGKEGLPVNLDNARLWYYLASKKGHVDALAAYNRLR